MDFGTQRLKARFKKRAFPFTGTRFISRRGHSSISVGGEKSHRTQKSGASGLKNQAEPLSCGFTADHALDIHGKTVFRVFCPQRRKPS